jgi:hypothetical protein
MTETRWSLLNLVSDQDADDLIAELEAEGYALRVFDGSGVVDKDSLIAKLAETFDFAPGGWDSTADDLWNRLLPDDDEGDRVAVIWRHVDELLQHDLASFLEAVDILKTIGRRAYSSQTVMLIFLLGADRNFARLAQFQ